MGWENDPVVDSEQAQSWQSDPVVNSNWSDLPGNIIPDAMNVGKGLLNMGERAAKGVMDLPKDAMTSAAEVVGGMSPTDTPLAQNIKTAVIDPIAGIPKQFGNLGSKEEWVNHPVQNAMTAGSVIAPMMAPEEEGMAASLGKAMSEKGSSLANDLGEVSGTMVKKVNPRVLGEEAQGNIRKAGSTSNISDVRSEIGKKLVDDNVVGGFGQDVGDRLQKVNELKDNYGKKVDSALDDIRKTNRATGEYADVDDAIHVQANPILKGILDTTNELRSSARSGLRQTSRFWRETYNSLAKKAESNGGRLNLDDIRSELQDVGKDMNAGPNTPRYSTSKDIYGHLAEIRDQMVNQIAEQSGNPALAKNLVEANKGYSFYSKIADGLQDAGAGGEVPEKMGKHLVRSTLRGDPFHATGYLGLMKVLNSVEPVMAQKLSKWGPGISKYGSILEAAAKKGPQNLAMTDYVLKQTDKDYAESMK